MRDDDNIAWAVMNPENGWILMTSIRHYRQSAIMCAGRIWDEDWRKGWRKAKRKYGWRCVRVKVEAFLQ